MSRNFELLQKAAQERATPGTQAERTWEPIKTPLRQSTPIAHEGTTVELQEPCREQVNKLVQRLFLLPGSVKAIVFSSVERGAGCTWIAAHAAESLAAQVSASVCLVDGNFRNPKMHSLFGVSVRPGLTDAVLNPAPLGSFVQQTLIPNLWLLTCGSSKDHGSPVPEVLRTRVMQLRAQFDYVVIDAPPVNFFTDGITLGGASDGVVLVLKANSSRREAAQKAQQELTAAKVRLAGAVLNQRTYLVPDFIYRKL